MLEVIGLISVIYFIGVLVTLVVLNTVNATWTDEIGFVLNLAFSCLWFVTVPVILHDKLFNSKKGK